MSKMSVDDVEFLHPGRYRWTLDDLAAKYLTETQYGQTRRQVIWEHFKLATETLRQTVPVAAVWVGGSFLSTKAEPSDVDAVYIVRGRAYDALDDESKQFVSVFNGREQLKANGLLVDSYVIHWTPGLAMDLRQNLTFSNSPPAATGMIGCNVTKSTELHRRPIKMLFRSEDMWR